MCASVRERVCECKCAHSRRAPSAFCCSLIIGRRLEQGLFGSGPHSPTPSNHGSSGGDLYFLFQVREQRGLESENTLEGGESRGKGWEGVVGELHPDEHLGPGGWILGREAAKAILQFLVQPLSLSVGLWVVS